MRPKMDSCEMCCGLRGHEALRQALSDELRAEYLHLVRETAQLESLFKDVCWYSFETKCRLWRHPWHQSWLTSPITLHSFRCTDGKKGEFPVYYTGPVIDAPELPVAIVLSELDDVHARLEELRASRDAPWEWAPGGRKYEWLIREGEGKRAFDALVSKQ